jgi:hypothetical protein
MTGGTVCGSHGGRLPRVRAAAQRNQVETEARAKAAKTLTAQGVSGADLNPVEALFDIAAEIITFKQTVNGMLAELQASNWRRDHRAGEQVNSLVTIFERSLDRTAKILVELNRLGLEDRRVRIAERDLALVGNALLTALDRAGISGQQRTEVIGYLQDELHAAQVAEDRRPAIVNNPGDRRRKAL